MTTIKSNIHIGKKAYKNLLWQTVTGLHKIHQSVNGVWHVYVSDKHFSLYKYITLFNKFTICMYVHEVANNGWWVITSFPFNSGYIYFFLNSIFNINCIEHKCSYWMLFIVNIVKPTIKISLRPYILFMDALVNTLITKMPRYRAGLNQSICT